VENVKIFEKLQNSAPCQIAKAWLANCRQAFTKYF